MGCLISRPRAPNDHNESTTNDVKLDRKSGRWSKRATDERGDNCDYATSKWHPEERSGTVLIRQPSAENITQTEAAQAPKGNKVIDLGQCDVGARNELVPLEGTKHKMSRRTRKRQRQAIGDTGGNDQDEAASQATGSFFLMLVPGRRHSAMRIDAAKGSNTSSLISVEQPDHQVVSWTTFPLNLNFLRPPVASRELSGKRKLNSSRQKLDQPTCSPPVASTIMVQEPDVIGEGAGSDHLSSGKSEQNRHVNSTLKSSDDVLLFTCLQQLCYEILNQKLCQAIKQQEEATKKISPGAAVCLFVFGRPGSSKGELAFDLVEHSSLVDLLGDRARLARLVNEPEANQDLCPIFHYVDVSALIVANIDERIRDYNKLVARTLRHRRSQLALVATRQESEELDDAASTDHQTSDVKSDELEVRQVSSFDSSIKQEESLEQNDKSAGLKEVVNTGFELKTNGSSENGRLETLQQQELRRASLEHQFDIMTLTTKQRSILQLKLMKYANCVTTKWITILIKQEINKLERRLRSSLSEIGELSELLTKVPPRIYLINLVPNQLSLFKSCLYLEQDLSLSDFHRPHYAIKFERRTNIRVLKKERRVKGAGQQEESKLSVCTKSFQFKLAHIKLPILVCPSLNRSTSHESLIMADVNSRGHGEVAQSLASVSCDLLSSTSGANEKLGPKFNETFAQKFNSCNRLLRVRFNPLDNMIANPGAEFLPKNDSKRDCCAQMMIGQSSNNTPMPSPTPSSLISMFAPIESKRQHQQSRQSSSFEHLNLLPRAPEPELSGSSSSSLIDLNRMHDNSSMISSTLSDKTMAPKWAIELRLVMEAERNSDKTDTGSESNRSIDRKASQQYPIELHTFHPPRSSCRSPLMSAAADRYQQLLSASSHHQLADHYALVPTRVAYANGTSQTILEVKRTHKRSLKFKSSQDLGKLLKLIERVRRQLIEDLDSWLAASIASEAVKLQKLTGELHPELAGPLGPTKRQPSLVAQVIRINLSQLKKENRCDSLTDHMQLLPELVHSNVAQRQAQSASQAVSTVDRLRPSLKTRPASSMGNEESTSDHVARQPTNGERKRRVQFRIDPADDERGERALLGPIQRRLWVNECLFVSCSDVELLESMNNFVELIQ